MSDMCVENNLTETLTPALDFVPWRIRLQQLHALRRSESSRQEAFTSLRCFMDIWKLRTSFETRARKNVPHLAELSQNHKIAVFCRS